MFKQLSPFNAFSCKSDLWVVQYPNTPLSFKIDWHLHFMAQTQKTHQPLLVESSPYLPCSHVGFIPLDPQQPSQWLAQARKIWIGLNKPSLKVFLPSPLKDIEKLWPYEALPDTIKWVTDEK